MRRGNHVLVKTPQSWLYKELERALRPFGLQAVQVSEWPVAALVDYTQGQVAELNLMCPVVALVNNTLEDRKLALESGASLAIAESDSTALSACLAEMVLSLELEPERILVVRSDLSRSPELMLLNDIGWNLRHGIGTQQCLEMLETFRPDLLLLDLDEKDEGPNLCRVLRADPRWRKLAVVFLVKDSAGEELALECGSDDVLVKGICPGKVLARIADRLQRFRPFRVQERDTLTGCLARRHAAPFLDRLVRLAIRKGKPFSLVMLDIDHFKGLNDTYGHGAGDEVLARFGGLLRHSFRQEDVVARWGGEEFLVALYDSTRENAARRLQSVCQNFREMVFDFDPDVRVSLTAGVAELGQDGYSLVELFTLVDQALYRGKDEGRDRVVLAESTNKVEDFVLVEDDEKLADLVTKLARLRGMSVRHLRTGEEAVENFDKTPPKVCILDYGLPGISGLDVLRSLPPDCGTRVIVVSGQESGGELEAAVASRGYTFLAKPFPIENLLDVAQDALLG